MPSPSTSPPTSLGRPRAFLANQGLYLVIAVALFAILRATNWHGAEFGAILLYSLVTGNLVSPAMNRVAPVSFRFRAPYNWMAYLGVLFVVAVVSSAAAVFVTMIAYRVPLSSFSAQFSSGGKLGVVVVLIAGTIVHLYNRTRLKLEHTSLELQRTLELGKTQSQLQEQELDKAREIQERLLPKRIPQIRGLDVAGAWQPASVVSGDYFDVREIQRKQNRRLHLRCSWQRNQRRAADGQPAGEFSRLCLGADFSRRGCRKIERSHLQ